MKSVLTNISTIIFDLGGVVLNLDTHLSLRVFSKYSGLSEEEIYTKFLEEDWSYAFEKGEIDEATFRNEVRSSLNPKITDTQIDESWNAMLLDLPLSRLQMIADLRDKYQIFALSNTNAIHIKAFNKIVATITDGGKIEQFFDKLYYSHELGMRKPEPEIYTYVLQLNNLKAEETLFIDDMEKNVISAKSVGLKTIHLTNQDYLVELFS